MFIINLLIIMIESIKKLVELYNFSKIPLTDIPFFTSLFISTYYYGTSPIEIINKICLVLSTSDIETNSKTHN